jgi:predicted peptidase
MNAATGLMLYLHGDGAEEFNEGRYSIDLYWLSKVAKRNNLLLAALKTPSEDLTWWKSGLINSQYIKDFIVDYIFKNFTINKDRVLLVGYSGGAEIITSSFLKTYGQYFFTGGAILLGGGSALIKPDDEEVYYRSSFINSFKLHFFSGTEDYMNDYVTYSMNYFYDRGFYVTYEFPEGENHYYFPLADVVSDQLNNGFLD